MQYETVELNKKVVVGISARTNNHSEKMVEIIGGLWGRFYQDGVYESISEKSTASALAVYCEFAGDKDDDYTVMVGAEVSSAKAIPDGCTSMMVPAGRYAKFSIKTTMENSATDVGILWGKIWQLNLPRTYIADFEEYFAPVDGVETVNVYVGLE